MEWSGRRGEIAAVVGGRGGALCQLKLTNSGSRPFPPISPFPSPSPPTPRPSSFSFSNRPRELGIQRSGLSMSRYSGLTLIAPPMVRSLTSRMSVLDVVYSSCLPRGFAAWRGRGRRESGKGREGNNASRVKS